MKVRHFRSRVLLGITLALTAACVDPGERRGVSGSSASVCPEGVRISAAGNVVGLVSGHIRQCFPGEALCFCDRDDDCYAETGYVPCAPPAADAGADANPNAVADATSDLGPDAAAVPPGVCPEGVRISAAGNVVGLTSGHIRQCFPGEARCFCDRDNDCYAEAGYVACMPPAPDAGADAAVDAAGSALDGAADGATDAAMASVCPEGVRISAAGNVVGLVSGHIRQCFPGDARCFCDRDDDCYAESGYVPCTPPAADAGVDVAVDVAVDGAPDAAPDASVDVTVCPDAGAPLVAPATASALAASRQSCAFTAGARVADTLGLTAAARARIPIDHVVILMQENHSFDQYMGTLPGDVDRIPAGYSNPTLSGATARPVELAATCTADPPHQWDATHQGWNLGAMNGFARVGEEAGIAASTMLGYYTERQIPFYRWLHARFAMSDRYFASVLSGTWATRDFAYLASSYGVRNTGDRVVATEPSIFDRLDAAGVSWGVYTDGGVRQDCIGWTNAHRGVYGVARYYAELAAGTLPSVVFLDSIDDATDEHPPADVNRGEDFVRNAVVGLMASPLWMRTAMFVTYDEAGGFFDHVAPPSACLPHPSATAGYDTTSLDRLGIRVPFVVVSPWARSRYVSHVVHDHTSMLRFVEALYDLPALTARDANASALFDLFDFACPQSLAAGEPVPAAGVNNCR